MKIQEIIARMEVDILFPEGRIFVPEKEWNASELLFLGNKKRTNGKRWKRTAG